MRALVFVLVLGACDGIPGLTSSCERRAAALATRFEPLVERAAEVDAWARPLAPDPPVSRDRLATLDLPYHASLAARTVSLDGAGRRYVADAPVTGGRATLCAAIEVASEAVDALTPVRVYVDAVADASLAFELLADLHSCTTYRVDLVFRRVEPPDLDRSAATAPPPLRVLLPGGPPAAPALRAVAEAVTGAGCPVDLEHADEAPEARHAALAANALVAAHDECGCVVPPEQIVAVWQDAFLPATRLTTLPLRTSPSAMRFEVRPDEPWQDAATRLVRYLRPASLDQPTMLWFQNLGALQEVEDVALPLP